MRITWKLQYIFLHDALVDFIKCGNRSIDCFDFQRKFDLICESKPNKEVMSHVEEELKSFKAHNSYVVTQMPLLHTISDFWQLVVEQECQTIVMLNDMDTEDERCVKYWPEELNTKEQYGRVQVELVSVKTEDFLILRDFKVTESLGKSFAKPHVQMVRQFQLLSWSKEADVPQNRGHLLDLQEKLQSWQHHHNIPADKWKPLVHCIDGGSRSGMFCGASFVLERMKIEQDVNAFLAVRYVSRNRPQFLTKLCHCSVDNECSGGTCLSGCDTSLPSGYNWRGSSCQIGNVGLNKPTNMTANDYYQKTYPATGAVDGIIPENGLNRHCAHLSNDNGTSAEWWTDLGDVYTIYNITLYARTDSNNDDRLQQFYLTVYNTSDNEVLCRYHHNPVFTHITITCDRPLIGRYVHFKKKASVTLEAAVLCEDVKTDFTEQTVRMNVVNVRLTLSVTALPNRTDEILTLLNKTSNSIEIRWQHIHGISPNITDFYGYLIQYKNDLPNAPYIDVGVLDYNSDPYWKIENLEINTKYSIKVIPFRKYGKHLESGKAYNILIVKTICSGK
ncbi:hypothetical protein LSH36_2023g00074 [Paralvinella palmiformis]|uniref:Protein-tyrosine-phosphatase n=1 Tax=Paralvinella palmiformis TaxID=53620 RepID=A0AAD9IRA6_9ANNE|nr:hypothetical protein LSH36_2023g00074 [Paralvinella palmiformis]